MKTLVAAIGLASVAIVLAACRDSQGPRFATEHEWVGRGEWIRGDTHVHTRASDGRQEIGPLVARARQHECDVVAITDRADRDLRAGTDEYVAAVNEARTANPELVIVTGMEWNVPPFGGREHATLLMPDNPAAWAMLGEFKLRFDDYERDDESLPTAAEALDWLVEGARSFPIKPVVVYNHPSRRDASSLENVEDMVAWRSVNDLVVGFEGGPGHQGKPPIGGYRETEPTIDRWDPVVARPGDAWDTLLQRGYDVVGAIASSDFHNDNPSDLNDFWPCQFAETWYYVPEKTTAGVLQALRAGAFYGVHGHIVRGLELTALVDGLVRPLMAGEGAQVKAGTEVPFVLSFDVPEIDWQQQPNQVNAVEFIVITPSGVDTRVHQVAGTGPQSVTERLVVGGEGVVVRARVRREVADGPDLMAYTNAIRLRAR